MNSNHYKRTKISCYYTYLAMSSVFSLPPLLFITFREMYGISYTLLGTLVSVNFCTQLAVDLIFSFFTKHFNIHKTIKIMPLLTSFGLLIYALVPLFFPQYAYIGFLIGTVIFALAAGLCEVLLSPLVAAIPSDNPKRDMSTLHSLYAYGVVSVIVVSTVFLKIFGTERWMYLTLFFALLPIISFILFCTSPLPEMNISNEKSSNGTKRKNFALILFAFCILLGGAAENTMTNWISTYMESVIQIPKVWGDIVGMAVFAVLIGLGRTVYAKYGKNISKVLVFGMTGSAICYLLVAVVSNVVVSIIACILIGLTTSMLWPGTLIMMEEKIPNPGVTAYALMAAGGDFGSSVAPQMLGAIVDLVSESSFAVSLGEKFSLTAEQVGMKAGMLIAAIFPMIGIFVVIFLIRYFKKNSEPAISEN